MADNTQQQVQVLNAVLAPQDFEALSTEDKLAFVKAQKIAATAQRARQIAMVANTDNAISRMDAFMATLEAELNTKTETQQPTETPAS